ncbi:arginine deiminase family protein [Pararhodobacter sp. SW119]|uniref:dimethylarginine dimethylaminohydrolase family protein n=1 Tax=Pararhodobacter sp. SW119 TaxID=2780075 RepID=UPI001FD837CD|nr:arginine deiminase family protein [Pararhodobacter sp. SW119]
MAAPLRRVMMRAPGAAMRAADRAVWHYGPGFDPARAEVQHAAFAELVADSGARIDWLEQHDGDGLSDAVFTHDPSFVTEVGGVILNMGKPLRRKEPALHRAAYQAMDIPILGALPEGATMEGGDTVWVDRHTLAVGRGARTNQAGIEAVADILRPHGITVLGFDLPVWTGGDACLHLMSLISPLADDLALVHRPLMPFAFHALLRDRGWRLIDAPPAEFHESFGLSVNVLPTAPGEVIAVDGFPETRKAMEDAGCRVQVFAGDALCIACEGGPTCLTRPILRAA